jgi:hypothetical protein
MKYSITKIPAVGITSFTVTMKAAVMLKREPIPQAQRAEPLDLPHERWWKGSTKPKNDWMKQRSYDGEVALTKLEQLRFDDLKQVARYCGDLMSTEWFARRWPAFRELGVTYVPGSRWCWGKATFCARRGVHSGRMTMSNWGIGKIGGKVKDGGEGVVLHELAHCITPNGHRHSPLWARTYLELVRFRMGKLAYLTLKRGFDEHGVRYRPYRVITDERRAQMARTLNLARQIAHANLESKEMAAAVAAGKKVTLIHDEMILEEP